MNRREFTKAILGIPIIAVCPTIGVAESLKREPVGETTTFPIGVRVGQIYQDTKGNRYLWCQYKGEASVNVGDFVMSDQVDVRSEL